MLGTPALPLPPDCLQVIVSDCSASVAASLHIRLSGNEHPRPDFGLGISEHSWSKSTSIYRFPCRSATDCGHGTGLLKDLASATSVLYLFERYCNHEKYPGNMRRSYTDPKKQHCEEAPNCATIISLLSRTRLGLIGLELSHKRHRRGHVRSCEHRDFRSLYLELPTRTSMGCHGRGRAALLCKTVADCGYSVPCCMSPYHDAARGGKEREEWFTTWPGTRAINIGISPHVPDIDRKRSCTDG